MAETKTLEPPLGDPDLQRILEELLAHDENITARAVARHHPTLKAASSITRSPARSALLAQYQQRQADFRRWQRRLPHQASAKIAAALADKDLRIVTLESQVQLLAASHLAMIKWLGSLVVSVSGLLFTSSTLQHASSSRRSAPCRWPV